ncbi:MAG TPA: T9SS type A sorting domain-containing protein [Cryomorphaceae bacterium]|nr:T9SS type A sorting domain-containing protein [Cryomorphaceae bacterium]
MRHFCFFFFAFFYLSANAQWEVIPSGTDSALYCVSSNDDHFFVGGATGMLLKSPTNVFDFVNVQEEYGTDFNYYPGNGITKIGIVNDTNLFYHFSHALHDVADENTVYTYWAGVSVGIDSNLVIISEERTEVKVDTSQIDYWTDPWFLEPGELADIGTIAWILRSTDATETYDLGTVFNTQIYTNSTHCAGARYVGCIDYYGNLLFSTDSAQTFSIYETPGWPFNFNESTPATEDFTATGFYFNEDLIGFYAPQDSSSSSLYRMDLNTITFTSSGISSDYVWNRITMIDDNNVIAVGDSGMIAKSVDSGFNWTIENVGTHLDLYGVESFGTQELILVGDSGLILTNSFYPVDSVVVSSDGGLNEINAANGTLQLFASVYPETAGQEVEWTLVNLSGTASINADGLVTAQGDGVVMAVARFAESTLNSISGSNLSSVSDRDHFFIQISGQTIGEEILLPADTGICSSNALFVDLPNANGEYLWQDGGNQSFRVISQTGTYWVTYTEEDFIRSDTIQYTSIQHPFFYLGENIDACRGDTLNLISPLNIEGASYLWSNGDTTQNISVTYTGPYSLEIDNQGCTASDQIYVYFNMPSPFDLGDDLSLCEGESVVLEESNYGEYLWSTGSTEEEITVTESGTYFLSVTNDDCIQSDSIDITFGPVPQFGLGPNWITCDSDPLSLNAGVNGATYLWSTGSEESEILVTESGYYEVAVTLQGCTRYDEISIILMDCNPGATDYEEIDFEWRIYPNPTSGEFIVNFSENEEKVDIVIRSSEGRLIKSKRTSDFMVPMDLSQQPPGVYIISARYKNKVAHKKLMIR